MQIVVFSHISKTLILFQFAIFCYYEIKLYILQIAEEFMVQIVDSNKFWLILDNVILLQFVIMIMEFCFQQTLAGAAQQTGKVIEGAKPIASATVQTISSADPSVIVVSAGALFIAYLILPPIWSVVSVNFRGYKGNIPITEMLHYLFLCLLEHFKLSYIH